MSVVRRNSEWRRNGYLGVPAQRKKRFGVKILKIFLPTDCKVKAKPLRADNIYLYIYIIFVLIEQLEGNAYNITATVSRHGRLIRF